MKQAVNFILICLAALALLIGAIVWIANKTDKKAITPAQNHEAWVADSVNNVRDMRIVQANKARIDSLEAQLAITKAGRQLAEAKNILLKRDADSARARLHRERTLRNCEQLVEKQDKLIAGIQQSLDSVKAENENYADITELAKANADTLFVSNARLTAAVQRAHATIIGLQQKAITTERRHRNAVFWYKTVALVESVALVIFLLK